MRRGAAGACSHGRRRGRAAAVGQSWFRHASESRFGRSRGRRERAPRTLSARSHRSTGQRAVNKQRANARATPLALRGLIHLTHLLGLSARAPG